MPTRRRATTLTGVTRMEQSKEDSLSGRVFLCAEAWFLAFAAMFSDGFGRFGWEGIIITPAYTPFGLAAALLLSDYSNRGAAEFIEAGSGWLYYVLLTVWCLRAKKHSVFIWVFTVLCISLLVNIEGCTAILHAGWKK